jgi:predicted ferric reductase
VVEIRKGTSAALVTIFGVITFFGFWANIWLLQSKNASAAAVGMSDMHMDNMAKFWVIPVVQGSGMAAILAAFLTIILGLQQSRKAVGWLKLSYTSIDRLHRHLSLLVLALLVVHVWATWMDTTGSVCTGVFWFNQCASVWPDAVWAYNLGIFAFYLSIVLGLSFYIRHKIGVQIWKVAHRFIVLFYIASAWHTLILGIAKEDYPIYFRPAFWLLQLVVLWLIARRFSELRNKVDKSNHLRRTLFTVLIVATILVAAFVVVATASCLVQGNIYWLNIT